MYSFILTAVGLLLLAAFVAPSRQRARACSHFIGVWFVLCACHIAWRLLAVDGPAGIAGLANVADSGQGFMHELGEHVMVFGFPALLAMALRKRFGAAA
jgi:hypothetical protein